jgi:hypothetical protein
MFEAETIQMEQKLKIEAETNEPNSKKDNYRYYNTH